MKQEIEKLIEKYKGECTKAADRHDEEKYHIYSHVIVDLNAIIQKYGSAENAPVKGES